MNYYEYIGLFDRERKLANQIIKTVCELYDTDIKTAVKSAYLDNMISLDEYRIVRRYWDDIARDKQCL